MANAILAEQGRRGVSLVLEALDPLGDSDADDHLLGALQNAWASDSIDLTGCIVDVLQAPRSEAELQGAIAFAGWAANHSDIAQTTQRLIEGLALKSPNVDTRKTARWPCASWPSRCRSGRHRRTLQLTAAQATARHARSAPLSQKACAVKDASDALDRLLGSNLVARTWVRAVDFVLAP